MPASTVCWRWLLIIFSVLSWNEVCRTWWTGVDGVVEANICCNNRQRFPALRRGTNVQGWVGVTCPQPFHSRNKASFMLYLPCLLQWSVDLMKPVLVSIHPSIRTYVCLPIRPPKNVYDFSEIWFVDRGWWVIHNGMPYDPIQSKVKVKVTEVWKLPKIDDFSLSPPPLCM